MNTISLYDSYQKQIVSFSPDTTVEKGVLKIYSCGPTVYNYMHIGNLRATWLPDMISRVATMSGYKVEWVQNITDVGHLVDDGDHGEDKMEKGARRENKSVAEIVDFYTDDFKKQCAAININLPSGKMQPKASEYIKEQMMLALELLRDGKAYVLEDGIYYRSENVKLKNEESEITNQDSSLLAKWWQSKIDGVVLQDSNSIKAILFDVDGVMTYGFENGEYKWPKQIAEKYNLDLTKIHNFFRDNQEPWVGTGDLKKQIESYLKDCGWQLSVDEFLEEWFNFDYHPVKETINLAKKLKEMGYTVAVATQQESYRNQFLKDNLLPQGLFEEVFSTCDVGFTKKDLNFWKHITDKLELTPNQIVMIDDNPEVLETSKKIGFKTILYLHGITNIDHDIKSLLEPKENTNYTGREIVNTTKNPEDFALWKFVEENALQKWKFNQVPETEELMASIYENDTRTDPSLPNRWGCPGWHSECVAMICSILGTDRFTKNNSFDYTNGLDQNKPVIDIHTGGQDHIDIHHKNEILQSNSLGLKLSESWVHNKFVLVDDKKMAKAVGNVFMITGEINKTGFYSLTNPPLEIQTYLDKKYQISGFDPLSYRLMLMEHHYSEQLNFTWEKLEQSQNRLWNLRKEMAKINSFAKLNNLQEVVEDKQIQVLLNYLKDNLDVPKFLEKYQTFLLDVTTEITKNQTLNPKNLGALNYFETVFLNLNLSPNLSSEILELGQQRLQAKQQKDYPKSDQIRNEILSLCFQIDDYNWGYGFWKRG